MKQLYVVSVAMVTLDSESREDVAFERMENLISDFGQMTSYDDICVLGDDDASVILDDKEVAIEFGKYLDSKLGKAPVNHLVAFEVGHNAQVSGPYDEELEFADGFDILYEGR